MENGITVNDTLSKEWTLRIEWQSLMKKEELF